MAADRGHFESRTWSLSFQSSITLRPFRFKVYLLPWIVHSIHEHCMLHSYPFSDESIYCLQIRLKKNFAIMKKFTIGLRTKPERICDIDWAKDGFSATIKTDKTILWGLVLLLEKLFQQRYIFKKREIIDKT